MFALATIRFCWSFGLRKKNEECTFQVVQAVQAFAENGSKLAGVDLAHWAINRRLGSEINVFDWAACQWGYLRSELAVAFSCGNGGQYAQCHP